MEISTIAKLLTLQFIVKVKIGPVQVICFAIGRERSSITALERVFVKAIRGHPSLTIVVEHLV